MDESKWERYAALGGIWFVVLNVIAAFLPGTPPSTDDSAEKIAKSFSDHRARSRPPQLLAVLGLIGLLWWFGSLWRLMVKAEDDRPRMAVVALAGLALGGAMALAGGAITSAVALQHQDVGGGAKFFYILSLVLFASAGAGLVVHIAAVTSLRTGRSSSRRGSTSSAGLPRSSSSSGRSGPRAMPPRSVSSACSRSSPGAFGSWPSASRCGTASRRRP